MKTNLFFLLLCFVSAIPFFACTKHAGDIEESVPTATITFGSPTTGAVYHTGDSVSVQCLSIASASMHGCEIAIKNAADTSVVYYHQHIHDHSDTLAINQKWVDTLTTAANLQVQVTLILDHEGHTATETVGFKSLPE